MKSWNLPKKLLSKLLLLDFKKDSDITNKLRWHRVKVEVNPLVEVSSDNLFIVKGRR